MMKTSIFPLGTTFGIIRHEENYDLCLQSRPKEITLILNSVCVFKVFKNYLAMNNTVDVAVGKLIAVCPQSVSDMSAVNLS
jgi:hypothetical protein